MTVHFIRIGAGLAAVAGLGVVADIETLLASTGAFFGGSAVLVTAYYSGRARLRYADADVIRAKRCDPMNSAFYPPASTRAAAPDVLGSGKHLNRLG